MLEGYSVAKVNGKFHVIYNESDDGLNQKHVATISPSRGWPRCVFDWHGAGMWRFRAADFVTI